MTPSLISTPISAMVAFQGDQAAQWAAARALPVDVYGDVRGRIDDGDVVAWACRPYAWWEGWRHPIRAGIQDVTGSVFVHVGLAGWWHGRLQVIEATVARGVSNRALSFYLPGGYQGRPHVKRSGAVILVLRPRYTEPGDGTTAVKEALAWQDMPYTLTTFRDVATGRIWTRLPGAANDVVCSSVAAYALGRVARPIVGTLGRLATPHDVVTSPHMDVIARLN